MSSPSPEALPPQSPLRPPRGPTAEEWASMTEAQRASLEDTLCEAACAYEDAFWLSLSAAEREAMAEGEEHQDASYGSREALRAFFGRMGRQLYIASNLPIFYPGEEVFSPDLIAVWDVPLRKRSSYLVVQEGKGLDLAVEVLHRGNRNKDLVDNVARYARLGIREYFVADLAKRRIHAYHLESAEAQRYTPLLGAAGRYRSEVLGLDLAMDGTELRFYAGTAVVPLLGEELTRLLAQVQRERELAATAEERAMTAEEKAEAAESEARRLREQLAESLLTILRLRGLVPAPEQEARVRSCQDSALLQRWLLRAATSSLEELFLDS